MPSPSQVTPTVAGTVITGGTAASGNLFHSFTEFSVPASSEARFVPGSAAIDAIVTRVTGDLASQIDGTLAVEGNASLFLLNPNGVFFGPGARLDLRGAFVASTADRVRFGDRGQFTADPAASSAPQLLTVAPSALFFSQLDPAPIENTAAGLSVDSGRSLLLVGGEVTFAGGRAIAPGGNISVAALEQPAEIGLVAMGDSLRLAVPDDFAGAPLTLDNGGGLLASGSEVGGRIEVRAGDIALDNGAELRAETFGAAASEGIDIRARSLTLAAGAVISANTFGLGDGGPIDVVADRIEIAGQASIAPLLDTIFLSGFSLADPADIEIQPEQLLGSLANGIFAVSLGPGNAGDIDLTVGALTVRDGAAIATTSFLPGPGGAGGDINITATEGIALTGGSVLASGTGGMAPSGNLSLLTPQLQVLDSLALTSTIGDGSGGTVEILAANRVELAGTISTATIDVPGGIFTGTITSGTAGDVKIDTDVLIVRDEASVLTSSLGSGPSGSLSLIATEAIELSESFPLPGNFSLSTSTSGAGNGGNISIATPRLTLDNGGAIAASTFAVGDGGSINVTADRVDIIGQASLAPLLGVLLPLFDPANPDSLVVGPEQLLGSISNGLFAVSLGPGNAGDITLDVGELTARDGAAISATSFLLEEFGGAGGQIAITASERVTVAGGSLLASGSGSALPSGDLAISTPQLRVLNSIAFTAAAGSGDGGNIFVSDADLVELAGNVSTGALGIPPAAATIVPGGLFTATISSGPAGNVEIDTGTLMIRDEASALTNSVLSPGASGNLTVTATEAVELSESFPGLGLSSLSASTSGAGAGGNIFVATPRLTLSNGGAIAASTFGPGDGGSIAIEATEVTLTGALPTSDTNALSLASSIAAVAADGGLGLAPAGNAGSIDIDLLAGGQLTISEGATIATSADFGTFGQGGTIDIDAGSTETGAIVVEGLSADGSANSTISAFTFGEGAAGTVALRAGTVRLAEGGTVVAATTGIAPTSTGGNITVEADTIALAGVPLGAPLATGFFTATLGLADAGDLTLAAREIAILDGALATTSTIAAGDSGTLSAVATDSFTVAGVSEDGQIVSSLISATLGTGDAGDLDVRAGGRLRVTDGGFVGAGTINPFLGEELVFFFPGFGEIPVPDAGSGGAGTARIAAETIELDNGAIGIETNGGVLGDANEASLTLNVSENLFLFNSSEITATALSDSDGGNIEIDTSQGSVVLNQGSSIAADAAEGTGGNIQIEATGLFVCETCSVTASSSFGSDGIVAVTSPEVNPADSLVILPVQPSDSAEQIVTGCAAQGGNRFAIAGRGGLPPDASDRLNLPAVWVDLRDTLAPTDTAADPPAGPPNDDRASERRARRQDMQETIGWQRHANGEIELVAAGAPTWQPEPPHCTAAATVTTTATAKTDPTSLESGAFLP